MCAQELMAQLQTGGTRADPSFDPSAQAAPGVSDYLGASETGGPAPQPPMFNKALMDSLMKAIGHV